MNRKKIMLSALGLTAAGLLLFGTTKIYASDMGWNNSDMISSLASKLGVSEDKIKSAFSSIRDERKSQMQAKFEEKLNQDVKDGKITEVQKKLILDKHQEMKTKREADWNNNQNLTPEQRKETMQKYKDELKTWAEQNGIPLSYFFGGMGRKMGRGGMHFYK